MGKFNANFPIYDPIKYRFAVKKWPKPFKTVMNGQYAVVIRLTMPKNAHYKEIFSNGEIILLQANVNIRGSETIERWKYGFHPNSN